MTTNTTHHSPAPPVDGPGPGTPWLPRSPLATGILLLTGVAAAWPLILAGAWSWINATGCFFDCTEPDPVEATALGIIAALVLVSPFAAVRFLQSRLAPFQVRLGVILLADLAALAFTVWWLRPV